MKKYMLALILALVISNEAICVPLLGETDGTIKEGLVTLYKDSNDINKVYFMPQTTTFSVDQKNVPLFNFVYWGLDHPSAAEPAGGYVTFTTHFAISADEKAALANYEKDHPNANVALLPIKKSMVGLSTTAKNAPPLSALFTEFNFPPFGGLPEAEIGINAVLTPIGAKVFKTMFKPGAGGSAISFQYCYTVQGYGPNMDANISVNMRRVYDYFEANSTGGYWWVSYSIKKVVESLRDERSIVITINGGDATEEEVLQKVAEKLTAQLFVPELAASPSSPAATNNVFNFGVSSVHKEELKTVRWNFTRRDLEEREFCTPVDIKDVQADANKLVNSAD